MVNSLESSMNENPLGESRNAIKSRSLASEEFIHKEFH